MNESIVILGNQLFPLSHLETFKNTSVFMAEDRGLCTHFSYHKQKLALFLSAMRHYRDELLEQNFNVVYTDLLENKVGFSSLLKEFITKNKIQKIHFFEIEDKFFEIEMSSICSHLNIDMVIHASPMFLTSREEFKSYLSRVKKPFMKTFYESQRRRTAVLMDGKDPTGGKFSFDSENRKKIPKDKIPLPPHFPAPDFLDREVIELVEKEFAGHPGSLSEFWVTTNRRAAMDNLNRFLQERLHSFGDYQDALVAENGFLFHSLISPALNIGLITPAEVVGATVQAFKKEKLPLNSVEGFIRQVIGWREFVRGIYQNFSEQMDSTNFWSHERSMNECWYKGETGIPPLDDSIKHALKYGYGHHIERLMVLANLMNLCEIQPQQVHRWFMEMYVDSSDWVMGPNVYGMGLMSEGGIFATKPYISGSNYILKMSHYKKGAWCDIWDGLYWRFIEKNYEFFSKNPRLGMISKTLSRMDLVRKERIFSAAEDFLAKVTH